MPKDEDEAAAPQPTAGTAGSVEQLLLAALAAHTNSLRNQEEAATALRAELQSVKLQLARANEQLAVERAKLGASGSVGWGQSDR